MVSGPSAKCPASVPAAQFEREDLRDERAVLRPPRFEDERVDVARFFPVRFFPVRFFPVRFFAVRFFAVLFFELHSGGTFAPFSRASLRPMAMA